MRLEEVREIVKATLDPILNQLNGNVQAKLAALYSLFVSDNSFHVGTENQASIKAIQTILENPVTLFADKRRDQGISIEMVSSVIREEILNFIVTTVNDAEIIKPLRFDEAIAKAKHVLDLERQIGQRNVSTANYCARAGLIVVALVLAILAILATYKAGHIFWGSLALLSCIMGTGCTGYAYYRGRSLQKELDTVQAEARQEFQEDSSLFTNEAGVSLLASKNVLLVATGKFKLTSFSDSDDVTYTNKDRSRDQRNFAGAVLSGA